MKQIFNPSFREQEGKYFIDYYTEPKPEPINYFLGKNQDCTDVYDKALLTWQKSKQSIEVHKSQVEGFKKLTQGIVIDKRLNNATYQQGISIPDGMVEIRNIPLSCKGANFIGEPCNFIKNDGKDCLYDCDVTPYAFLKQETKLTQ